MNVVDPVELMRRTYPPDENVSATNGHGGYLEGGNPKGSSRDSMNPPTGLLSLPFLTLAEAIEGSEEPQWLWTGFVAPGALTVYSGAPKVGKSTLLFALFAALRDGSDFLGQPTRQAGIALLTEERNVTLAEKAAAFAVDRGDKFRVLPRYAAPDVEWPTLIGAAVAFCINVGLGVLVIDTWDKWAPVADENNAADVNAALQPLYEAAGAGLAVVVVHHNRKTGGSHGSGLRGSNALAGGADVIVELKRMESFTDPTVRRLEVTSRFSGSPDEMYVRLADGGYEVVDDALSAATHAIVERIAALVEEGVSDVHAIASAASCSVKTATKHLRELEGAERVMQISGTGVKGRPLSFLPWQISGGIDLSTQTSLLESGAA
jgi:hypothetical protein